MTMQTSTLSTAETLYILLKVYFPAVRSPHIASKHTDYSKAAVTWTVWATGKQVSKSYWSLQDFSMLTSDSQMARCRAVGMIGETSQLDRFNPTTENGPDITVEASARPSISLQVWEYRG